MVELVVLIVVLPSLLVALRALCLVELVLKRTAPEEARDGHPAIPNSAVPPSISPPRRLQRRTRKRKRR